MNKKILLLSTLGVAGGLLYALESNRRKQNGAAGRRDDSDKGLDASEDRRSAENSARQNGGRQTGAAASMAKIENGKTVIGNEGEHAIDDQGTDQSEASEILRHIRDNAFEASDEKLALALGRPTEEIEEWTNGNGLIDGDVVMKARTLAMQRGVEV